LTGAGRVLHCSFCAASWLTESRACVYCAAEPAIQPDAEDRPDRELELCDACGGYLKAARFPHAAPFPLIAIEDLATADLDRRAMECGFSRLTLPTIYPPSTPPSKTP
jgi:formate dehydrogenase maturation protein FdhE